MPKSPVQPIELHFDGNKKDGNIVWANIYEHPFNIAGYPTEKLPVQYDRKKTGAYHRQHSLGEPLTQLDVIDKMIEGLKSQKGQKIALIVRDENNDPVKKLSYDEAKTYLAEVKKTHLSRDHALKEMKDLIRYANSVGGQIGEEDNTYLGVAAQQFGFELVYKTAAEQAKEAASKAKTPISHDKHAPQDQIVIQDIKTHKPIETVKNLKIGTKDKTVYGL